MTTTLQIPGTTDSPVQRRSSVPSTAPVVVTGHDPDSRSRRVSRSLRLAVSDPWRSAKPILTLRLAILLPILLFGFSLYQNLSNMDTVDFHRDEARWINRAYFLEDLFHPFSDTWSDYYTTRGQPPLGNYLMGLGLIVHERDLDTNRVWDFHYDEDWNVRNGAMPDPADLAAGRRSNAVVGALVVVCAYAMASRLTNRLGGFAAGLLLSIHPLHLRLSSQALSDELLALTLMLSFLLAWRFARTPSIPNALLLGTLLGLGGAAKLSPMLLSIPLAAFGALWLAKAFLKAGRSAIAWQRARYGWLLVIQPAIAFAAFVIVNPYLWPNPIGRTMELVNFRRSEMDGQSSAWPIADVENPLVAMQRTGRRFNLDYSSSLRIQDWFADTASTVPTTVSLDVIVMVAGVVILVALVVKRGLWSPTALSALLMAASSATIIAGMGVDFYRYFLPLLIVLAVCFGVAVGAALELARGRLVTIGPHRGTSLTSRFGVQSGR
jgi:4-amino-4-deoxy-L-arabinose transferase-like glycosyltransferase